MRLSSDRAIQITTTLLTVVLTVATGTSCGDQTTGDQPTIVDITLAPTTTTPPSTTAASTTSTTTTTTTTTTATTSTTTTTSAPPAEPTMTELVDTLIAVTGPHPDGATHTLGQVDGSPIGAVSDWASTTLDILMWDGEWADVAQLELGDSRDVVTGISPRRTWISIVDVTGEGDNDIVVWFYGPRRPVGVIASSANGEWSILGEGQQLQIAAPGLITTITNDCDPSCAEGTERTTYYAWTNGNFSACRELDMNLYDELCALTPG